MRLLSVYQISEFELPTKIYYKVNKSNCIWTSSSKTVQCSWRRLYSKLNSKSLSMECQFGSSSYILSQWKSCNPTSDCTFIYQGKKRHANETWHTFCLQKLLLCYFLKTIRSTMHNVLLHASGNFLRSIFWMNNGQGTWHKMHQKPRQLLEK